LSSGKCPGQPVQPQQQVLLLDKQDLPEYNPQPQLPIQQYPKDPSIPYAAVDVDEQPVVEEPLPTLYIEETEPETLETDFPIDRLRYVSEDERAW
jgi:hypothetical protein